MAPEESERESGSEIPPSLPTSDRRILSRSAIALMPTVGKGMGDREAGATRDPTKEGEEGQLTPTPHYHSRRICSTQRRTNQPRRKGGIGRDFLRGGGLSASGTNIRVHLLFHLGCNFFAKENSKEEQYKLCLLSSSSIKRIKRYGYTVGGVYNDLHVRAPSVI